MATVIKVGGSLAETPNVLKTLGAKLSILAETYQVIIVPGGGVFADAVRKLDVQFHLSPATSHKLAILAMNEYGMLLSEVVPNSSTCETLEEANQISINGRAPILLPAELMNKKDPFEPSWDVTSDSIAAQIALLLRSNLAVFVTDVDGIFPRDPKLYSDAKLIEEISANELLRFRSRTSVDKYLPNLLLKNSLDCYVVNGQYPDRVAAILAGCKTIATHIQPRNKTS